MNTKPSKPCPIIEVILTDETAGDAFEGTKILVGLLYSLNVNTGIIKMHEATTFGDIELDSGHWEDYEILHRRTLEDAIKIVRDAAMNGETPGISQHELGVVVIQPDNAHPPLDGKPEPIPPVVPLAQIEPGKAKLAKVPISPWKRLIFHADWQAGNVGDIFDALQALRCCSCNERMEDRGFGIAGHHERVCSDCMRWVKGFYPSGLGGTRSYLIYDPRKDYTPVRIRRYRPIDRNREPHPTKVVLVFGTGRRLVFNSVGDAIARCIKWKNEGLCTTGSIDALFIDSLIEFPLETQVTAETKTQDLPPLAEVPPENMASPDPEPISQQSFSHPTRQAVVTILKSDIGASTDTYGEWYDWLVVNDCLDIIFSVFMDDNGYTTRVRLPKNWSDGQLLNDRDNVSPLICSKFCFGQDKDIRYSEQQFHIPVTVKYQDGEVVEYHNLTDLTENIKDIAGCSVFPESIRDAADTYYRCEWSVNIVSCP